ncbi:MAG: VanZ family protein [Deltaproteobacteria bacterium]|nr:VanZ family protein [Deltaproteobacteria bacterium]
MNSRVRSWWPVAAWAVVVLTLSSIPRFAPPSAGIPHVDKLAHFLEYAVLALLLVRGLSFEPRTRAWPALALVAAAVAAIAVFGALDELHQSAIPGRSTSGWDWLADSGGGVLGAAAGARLWLRRRKARRSHEPV